jgi:hypothetical protein
MCICQEVSLPKFCILCIVSPVLATYPAHHSLPDFTILTLPAEFHKPLNSSLYNIQNCSLNESLLPTIFVIPLFSKMHPLFKVRGLVVQQYKTNVKITVYAILSLAFINQTGWQLFEMNDNLGNQGEDERILQFLGRNSLIRHGPHRKRRLQQLFVAAGTSLPSCYLATIGGYTDPRTLL